MLSTYTKHAACRAQQRCIDPLLDEWLDRFGEEEYDGRGYIRKYFSKKSIRSMERAFGRESVRRYADKLHVYKVESSRSGDVITTGYRTKHIKRR
jgi:hypothetical protein